MSSKRKKISYTAEEAAEEILRLINDSDDENDETVDLHELNGEGNDFLDGETEEETPEEPVIESRRKLLTSKRLVNSIQTALRIENYNPLILDPEERQYTGKLTNLENRKYIELIKFTNKQPPGTGRQAQWDVIKEKCGVIGTAKDAGTIIDAFRLFITEDMMQIIVDNTNNNINKVIEQHHQKVESDKYTFLEPTTYE